MVTFIPYDRPVRAAFVGLGRIYDLNMRAYAATPTSRWSRWWTLARNAARSGRPTGQTQHVPIGSEACG